MTNNSTPSRRPSNQRHPMALPGWAIDLITDGVPANELHASGRKALWRALVRTAVSAQNHHWSVMEWESLILDDTRRLAHQLSTRDGQRALPKLAVLKELGKAWDTAWEWRSNQKAWSPQEATSQVARRAEVARAIAANADNDLLDVDRAVLELAAYWATERRNTKVALPWRPVAKKTAYGQTAVRNSLRRLDHKGLLPLVERGRPRGPSSKAPARASIHMLPAPDDPALTPYLSRETRPVVPSPTSVVPPPDAPIGAPANPVGSPEADTAPITGRHGSGEAAELVRLVRHPGGRVEMETNMPWDEALKLLRATQHLASTG